MKVTQSSCLLLLAVFSANVIAQKDPSTRDENISDTNVTVSTRHLDNGLYEYIYTLSSGEFNKGKILSFLLDISCKDYPQVSTDSNFITSGYGINASTDSSYIPVKVAGRYEQFPPHITIDNKINWLVGLLPGGSVSGYKVISPNSPAKREYTLKPEWETRWWGYDEEYIPESWPWVDDFIVTGLINGPSCPSEQPTLYPGSGDEVEAISNLLSYSEPERDRWHVGADTDSLTLTIHYDQNIDPKTFKTEPGWTRSFFNPVPGGSDTAILNLKKGKNIFRFSVSPKNETVSNNKNKHYHSNVDIDVFEIRKEMKK